MRRSRWIILGVAGLTAVSLIPPAVVTTREQSLLMAVWGMPFEDVLFRDGYAREFEALHPGWTVEYQRHGQLVDKYKAWHIQGRGADVMRLPITNYHSMIDLGIIEPLDRFINDPEYGLSEAQRADFFPAIWDTLDVDGRRYALPSDNSQYGLYYNVELFDAYNLAHPDAPLEYPHADWTWSDLKRASTLLTVRDEDGRIGQYGIAFDLWAWPFMTFLKQAGGELWDDQQTTTLIDSEAGVKALEFIVSLIPPDSPIRAPDHADTAAGPVQLFKVGRVAILLDGCWDAPNIEKDNPDLDFAIAPLPHDRRRAVVSGSVLWAMSSHSKDKRMAWRMIKWLVSAEGSMRYWQTLRVAPPASLSLIESEAFRSTTGFVDPVTDEVRGAMPRDRYDARAAWLQYTITPDPATGVPPGFVPVGLYQPDLESAIGTALVDAVRGDKSAREALRDAARETHSIIDRDRRAKALPAVERQ